MMDFALFLAIVGKALLLTGIGPGIVLLFYGDRIRSLSFRGEQLANVAAEHITWQATSSPRKVRTA